MARPPKHPLRADDALRMLGRMPRETNLPEELSPSERQKRMRNRIRQAAKSMRRLYKLTVYKDPLSKEYLYDANEIEAIKTTKWKQIAPAR